MVTQQPRWGGRRGTCGGAEARRAWPSAGRLSAPEQDGGGGDALLHAHQWGRLTCSVSPKESLWMTWVMSGFCGWAVALCVDTWKLPGTWGREESLGPGRRPSPGLHLDVHPSLAVSQLWDTALSQPQTPRLRKEGANSTHWRGRPGCGVEGACEGPSWAPGEGPMTKPETQPPIISSLAAPRSGGRRADSGSVLTPQTPPLAPLPHHCRPGALEGETAGPPFPLWCRDPAERSL